MDSIRIDRGRITKLIESINQQLVAKFHKDGKLYETSLRSHLMEGMIIAERRFNSETPENNINIIRESKIQCQEEIGRLENKIANIVFGIKNYNDNEAVIEMIRERIQVQEYIIQFLDLLHEEYMKFYLKNTLSTDGKADKINTLTFKNIQTRFAEGVNLQSNDFEIFDELGSDWPEGMAKSKEKTIGKVNDFLGVAASAYRQISNADSPQQALEILQSLQEYYTSEANKPSVTGGMRKMPDGTMSVYNVSRDKRFDKLAERVILPTIKNGINDIKRLIELQKPDITFNQNKPDSKNSSQSRTEETLRLARRAVTLFEDQIKFIVQREKGKVNPLSNKEIVNEAIKKYCELAPAQRFAATDKGIMRYLLDIGKKQTARNYAGQLVRQFRGDK